MEVSVTGDQAAMPVVSGTPVLHVSFNSGEDNPAYETRYRLEKSATKDEECKGY